MTGGGVRPFLSKIPYSFDFDPLQHQQKGHQKSDTSLAFNLFWWFLFVGGGGGGKKAICSRGALFSSELSFILSLRTNKDRAQPFCRTRIASMQAGEVFNIK